MKRDVIAVRLSREDRALIEGAARVAQKTRSDILREGARERARNVLRQAAETDGEEPARG